VIGALVPENGELDRVTETARELSRLLGDDSHLEAVAGRPT
jgi:hypothetical protein